MKTISGDNFCEVEKYKLYRSVYDILHPTISKKNISNYKVVLDEKLLPMLVFYPQRVSNINSIIIMIPGCGSVSGSYGKYSDICKKMAKETEKLVIAIDYFGRELKYPTTDNKIVKIISYLYEELKKNGIREENVTIMSDSTGCSILGKCLSKLVKKGYSFGKLILLYPICRSNYSDYKWNDACLNINFNLDKKINNYLKKYYARSKEINFELFEVDVCNIFQKSLVVTGDMDVLRDEGRLLAEKLNSKYKNIKFASHGFLSSDDEEVLSDAYKEICEFVNE